MDTSYLNIVFPGANQLIREKYSDELEEAELEMVRDGSNSEKAVLISRVGFSLSLLLPSSYHMMLLAE